jgi:hypothetical protein
LTATHWALSGQLGAQRHVISLKESVPLVARANASATADFVFICVTATYD